MSLVCVRLLIVACNTTVWKLISSAPSQAKALEIISRWNVVKWPISQSLSAFVDPLYVVFALPAKKWSSPSSRVQYRASKALNQSTVNAFQCPKMQLVDLLIIAYAMIILNSYSAFWIINILRLDLRHPAVLKQWLFKARRAWARLQTRCCFCSTYYGFCGNAGKMVTDQDGEFRAAICTKWLHPVQLSQHPSFSKWVILGKVSLPYVTTLWHSHSSSCLVQ